jgi:hypothetical protein
MALWSKLQQNLANYKPLPLKDFKLQHNNCFCSSRKENDHLINYLAHQTAGKRTASRDPPFGTTMLYAGLANEGVSLGLRNVF